MSDKSIETICVPEARVRTPLYNTDENRAAAVDTIRAAARVDVSEAFEIAAGMFQRDTGLLAVGKDQSAAEGGYPSYEERSAAWLQWRKEMGV